MMGTLNTAITLATAIKPNWVAVMKPMLGPAYKLLSTISDVYKAGQDMYAVFTEQSEWRE
jgi:hypothetical protein